MSSEPIRIDENRPAGHRDRHTPHLCPECLGPLTADGRCTRCTTARLTEPPSLGFPDRRARLRRMERVGRL